MNKTNFNKRGYGDAFFLIIIGEFELSLYKFHTMRDKEKKKKTDKK
jgi:hypothetical protein